MTTQEHKKEENVKHAPPPFHALSEKQKISQMEKLADCLERMRLGDYVTNLNKTSRILWLGFVSGIARGVGMTIGATLVIAILFKIISALISMNVPYISDMMKEFKQTLENRYSTTQVQVQTQNDIHTMHRRRY